MPRKGKIVLPWTFFFLDGHKEKCLTKKGAPNVHQWYTKDLKKIKKATEQDSPQNNLSIHNLGYLKYSTLWPCPSHCILRSLQQGFQKSLLQSDLTSLPHRISFNYALSKCTKINITEPCTKPSFAFSPSHWPSTLGEGFSLCLETPISTRRLLK